MRGIPAIGWTNVSILSPLYACQNQLASPFAAQGPPRKTAAALKMLGVNGVIRVGLSSDLDVPFDDGVPGGVPTQHLAFAGARSLKEKVAGGSPARDANAKAVQREDIPARRAVCIGALRRLGANLLRVWCKSSTRRCQRFSPDANSGTRTSFSAPVAQCIERIRPKDEAAGEIPAGSTTRVWFN